MKKLIASLLVMLAFTVPAFPATSFYSNNVSGWSLVGRDNYCVASKSEGQTTATIKVNSTFLGFKDLNLYLSNGNWTIPETGTLLVEKHQLKYQKIGRTTILIAEVGNTLNDLSGSTQLHITSDFFKPITFDVNGASDALKAFSQCVDKL